ncbi:MAG: hypothetical protein JWO38_5279 [Gemmataceae bacterium]|nr:hypothetical protein [Gemmataceae bacterium]
MVSSVRRSDTPRHFQGLTLALRWPAQLKCCRTLFASERQSTSAREGIQRASPTGLASPAGSSPSMSNSSSDRHVAEVHWRQGSGRGSRSSTPAWRSDTPGLCTSGVGRRIEWPVDSERGAGWAGGRNAGWASGRWRMARRMMKTCIVGHALRALRSAWNESPGLLSPCRSPGEDDFAIRTQSTRFLHNPGRSDAPTGSVLPNEPNSSRPRRCGPTAGAGGRSILRNEPNSGAVPARWGSLLPNEPNFARSCFPADGQSGLTERARDRPLVSWGCQTLSFPATTGAGAGPRTDSAKRTQFPGTLCLVSGQPFDTRRVGGRFCQTNPIRAGGIGSRSGVPASVRKPVDTREEPGRS